MATAHRINPTMRIGSAIANSSRQLKAHRIPATGEETIIATVVIDCAIPAYFGAVSAPKI